MALTTDATPRFGAMLGGAGLRRKPGRPRASESAAERERHVRAYVARRSGMPTPEVARLLDVSERTVRNWVRLASDYPDRRVTDFGPDLN